MATTELFGSVSEVVVTTQGGPRYAGAGRTFVSQRLNQSLADKLGAPRVLLAEVFLKTEGDMQNVRARAKGLKDVVLPPQILKPVVFADVKLEGGEIVKVAGYPLNGELLSEIPDLPGRFGVRAANALMLSLVESVVSLPAEPSGSAAGSVHGGVSPERVIIPALGSDAAVQLAGLGTAELPDSLSKMQELMQRDIEGLRAVGRVLPVSVAFAGECAPSKPGSKPSSLLSALESALKREGDNPVAQTPPLEMSDFVPPAPMNTTDLVAPISAPEVMSDAPNPLEREDVDPGETFVPDPSGYGLVVADAPLPESTVVGESANERPMKPAEQAAEVRPVPEEAIASSSPPARVSSHARNEDNTETEPDSSRESWLDRMRGAIPSSGPQNDRGRSEDKGMKSLLTRRNLLIGGAGAGIILVGSLAAGAMSGKKSQDASGGTEVRSVSTLTGYADSGSWTVPVATSAQVFAAEAGVLVANGPKVEVHSFSAPGGKTLVRSIDLGGELDLAFDTKIGDKAALVMQSGQKLLAYVDGMGADGKLIEASLSEGARISGSGSSAAVLSGSSAAVLLSDGLVEFKRPEEGAYASLAADTEGLISVAFDAPVMVTDRDGKKVSSATLSAVADGWGVHSWIGAGHGKVVSLWAQDAYTQDGSAEVILAVHSAANGSLLGQKQMLLSDAAEKSSSGLLVRPLRVGQGGQTAVFGRFVIRLSDGTFRDDLPADAVVKKIKGEVIVAEDTNGSSLVFTSSETQGVKFTGAIMAQVSSGLLVQRGNALVLLPGNQA